METDFLTRLITLNALGPNFIQPKNKPFLVWICNQCDTEHEEEDDAIECCKPQVSERYKCPVCRKTHYAENKAADCCPCADVGQPMQCPVCMKSAESFQEAADCCLHTHTTLTKWGREKVAEAVKASTPWADAIKALSAH